MEQNKQAVSGPISAVPCPWCGNRNDLSNLFEQGILEGSLHDDSGKIISRGSRVDCDHCKRLSVVEKVDTRPRVILRQYHGR